ncbi:PilW family protein [Pseudomonas sp. DWP3-1-2]|uniref:PilW family protein n=1 Tax=Pseudomonas sp. DWP3-1-2 TaxID=2804645 RepID=UPI003CEA4C8F
MRNRSGGFGLVEIMIALVLGLVIMLGVTQTFVSAKNTYASQNASAVMQEDARFVLSKLVQEIRMVGMFGCLQTVLDSSATGDFKAAQTTPISWDNATGTLTLITSATTTAAAAPNWTIRSDCKSSATAYTGVSAPANGQMAFPIRKLVYRFANGQITLGGQPLVSNVSAFTLLFGLASSSTGTAVTSYSATPSNAALIRSVNVVLTLSDPKGKVRDQRFSVVAALRNRLE